MAVQDQLFDEPGFDAGDIAAIAGLSNKEVANWTDRGFADPYHAGPSSRRGRGQARSYSLRDGLRFALMGDLAKRYQIPLPLGKRICGAIFSECFSPGQPGYRVVEGATAEHVATAYCADATELATYFKNHWTRSGLIVDTRATLLMAAAKVVAGKLGGPDLISYCQALQEQGKGGQLEE